MAITPLIFLALYFGGLALAVFKHPKYGLYAYLVAFYLHPPDRWWGDQVPNLRWALYAALITFVLTIIKLDPAPRTPWHKTAGGKFFVLYALWMLIQTLWAITGNFHQEGLELFIKYALLFYLIYRLVDTEKEILNFFLIHLLGSFYLGWLAFGTNVRGRLDGMGGPGIDDANTFSMHLTTAAIFGAALLLRGPAHVRLIVLGAMPFVLNGIILTQSRGAFIGIVAAAILILLLRPKAKGFLFYSLAGLGLSLFLALSPPEFLNRMQTITTAVETRGESDTSADARLVVARAELQMAKDFPLGTGHRGTRVLSPAYIDERYLTVDAERDGFARSSHNTILAVLVDQGIPGLLLYLWLLFAVFKQLFTMKGLDADRTKLKANFGLSAYRMALGAALGAVVASGMFSNFLKAEVFVWLVALVACLSHLVERETAAGRQPAPAPLGGNDLTASPVSSAHVKNTIEARSYTNANRTRPQSPPRV